MPGRAPILTNPRRRLNFHSYAATSDGVGAGALDGSELKPQRWEVVGSDKGLRSVHLHALDCTADEAAQLGVDRVRRKYGAATDLAWWTFSVWENGTPSTGERLTYRVDAAGQVVRF